jgi:ankyrin repeat protein
MKVIKVSCISKFAILILLFSIFPIELIADPLVDAVRSGSIEKAKKLIEDGYDVNSKDREGFTALMFSAEMGNLELVKYLVTHGADVNATNKYMANALHKVLDAEKPGTKKLSAERIQIAHYLINNGIDVRAKGYNDTT